MNIFDFRDRNSRTAVFDGIEEGGIRASSSYSSHEIDEHENDRAVDGLQDRVNMLKRASYIFKKLQFDFVRRIHEEVESHNLMLERMFCGNDMDGSIGVLSGTMDKFKIYFSNLILDPLFFHQSIITFRLYANLLDSRCSRPNLAGGCLLLWHLLGLFSLSYTISLDNWFSGDEKLEDVQMCGNEIFYTLCLC
ncbi:Bet1-like SNARE 1-1 family protein [Striga asiatica]|uniref:Bet1-like SNARE 1-1 family protein n=1 Tax=Striga asiatica TaxID=4170 RepID=A0A5A7PVB6_STRAF|nr:Bet1-like SNARE 1-1 family protein [Striga asiatica]